MSNGSKTDWDRLAKTDDQGIDTSDIPELNDDFFRRAEVHLPGKKAVTIRLDADVLSGSRARARVTRRGSTNCCASTCRPTGTEARRSFRPAVEGGRHCDSFLKYSFTTTPVLKLNLLPCLV